MARLPNRIGSISTPWALHSARPPPAPSRLQGRPGGSCIRAVSSRARPSRVLEGASPTGRTDRAPALLRSRLGCASVACTLNAGLGHAVPRRLYSSSAEASSSSVNEVQSERPEPPDYLDEKEKAIFNRLNEALAPVELQVEDISGGCGSMYALAITAERFKGLPVIKQHRLVNEVLGEDIKSWHGIQLRTKAP